MSNFFKLAPTLNSETLEYVQSVYNSFFHSEEWVTPELACQLTNAYMLERIRQFLANLDKEDYSRQKTEWLTQEEK